MKMTSSECACYRIPLPVPWGSATHRITHHELVITRVRTDTGQEGIGWSFTIGTGGTAVSALLGDELLPRLRGTDPTAVEERWHDLWRVARDAGGGGIALLALASADVALWDLRAKIAGQPLYRALGACRDRVPAYGSGVNLNLSPDELLAQARRWQARGFRAFKMKVGSEDPEVDVARVRAVREVIGPRGMLMVDANQKWTAGEAVQRTRALEPFDLYWIEEPIPADDVAGHVVVRSHVHTPVAVGENLTSAHRFAEYLRCGAVDVAQPDVSRVGGITPWMRIAHLANGHNVPVAPHLVLELSGHLLCAVPQASMLEDVDGGSLTELGVLAEPIRVQDGIFTPPPHPGHGVRFDWNALARWRVRPGARHMHGAAVDVNGGLY